MFQHWIKKKNFPHRHQTYEYEWSISVEDSASETPTNLSSLNVDIFQTTINSWAEVTSWGSRKAWYRVIRVLHRWQISLWHFPCLRMGTIDVITYEYVINIVIDLWTPLLLIKDEILLTVSCPIFPSILIAKNLLTGSLKNRSIDNLETQKKSISMKNSQFFDYLLYAKSK